MIENTGDKFKEYLHKQLADGTADEFIWPFITSPMTIPAILHVAQKKRCKKIVFTKGASERSMNKILETISLNKGERYLKEIVLKNEESSVDTLDEITESFLEMGITITPNETSIASPLSHSKAQDGTEDVVDLRGRPLTEDVVLSLCKKTQCKALLLDSCTFQEAAGLLLGEAVKTMNNLVCLSVHGSNLGSFELKQLITFSENLSKESRDALNCAFSNQSESEIHKLYPKLKEMPDIALFTNQPLTPDEVFSVIQQTCCKNYRAVYFDEPLSEERLTIFDHYKEILERYQINEYNTKKLVVIPKDVHEAIFGKQSIGSQTNREALITAFLNAKNGVLQWKSPKNKNNENTVKAVIIIARAKRSKNVVFMQELNSEVLSVMVKELQRDRGAIETIQLSQTLAVTSAKEIKRTLNEVGVKLILPRQDKNYDPFDGVSQPTHL